MPRFVVAFLLSLGIAAVAVAADVSDNRIVSDKHVDENFVLTPPDDNVEANRKTTVKLIGADKILFVKRLSYSSNHYYTEYLNSAWRPGGNLAILDLKTGQVTDICPKKMELRSFHRARRMGFGRQH